MAARIWSDVIGLERLGPKRRLTQVRGKLGVPKRSECSGYGINEIGMPVCPVGDHRKRDLCVAKQLALDDETYDWHAVVTGLVESRGWPLVVDEDTLLAARRLAQDAGYPASATGAAGLAGLLSLARDGHLAPDENVVVLMTGVER